MEREGPSISQINLLEKKLADEPIVLPSSPFWDVIKTFGRDELIALGINTVGTIGIGTLTGNLLLLSTAGPVVEKAGFFAAYANEAREVYTTTPEAERKPRHHYVIDAIRNGFPNLAKDIAVHDPLYTSSMYLGLQAYPETPAWMLSMLTFGIAIGAVAVGEVAVTEIAFHNLVRRLKRAGFGREPYLESRFVIKDNDPQMLLEELAQSFNLGEIQSSEYHDRYFETQLRTYNSRKPAFRFRERTREGGSELAKTAQVIYTRASEMGNKSPTQFNYYPISKDKLWKELGQDMPESVDEIEDVNLRKVLEGVIEDSPYHDVVFTREYARDPERLLISVDVVGSATSPTFIVVEVKAYRKREAIAEMIKAMRHVMHKYDVIQTTHNKRLLTGLNNK